MSMKEVFVGLQTTDNIEPVGVIRFDTVKRAGVFAYLQTYAGPPLDPINLDYRDGNSSGERAGSSIRLGPRVFGVDAVACPGLIHRVFQDALPGAWGMQVLRTEYPELRGMLDCDLLYWFGSRTSGALCFFVRDPEDELPVNGIEALVEVRRKSEGFQKTFQAMELFGLKNPAVASHGGVMPKASYVDENGTHWLAKFDPIAQGGQFTRLEHLASQVAAMCGVDVPTTQIVEPAGGGEIFLSKRYDRQNDMRTHRISMFSLMPTSTVRDTGEGDYKLIFDALKKTCTDFQWVQQASEMLRRMAFNIGLNVLDDHLRNHEMLLDPIDGEWRLAPAFDLVPTASESPHGCGLFGRPNASLDFDKEAGFWNSVADTVGLTREYVEEVVREMQTSIQEHWPQAVELSALNEYNKAAAMMAMKIGCGERAGEAQAIEPPVDCTKVSVYERSSGG